MVCRSLEEALKVVLCLILLNPWPVLAQRLVCSKTPLLMEVFGESAPILQIQAVRYQNNPNLSLPSCNLELALASLMGSDLFLFLYWRAVLPPQLVLCSVH